MIDASYSTASLGQPLMPYAHPEHSFSSTSFIQPLPSAHDSSYAESDITKMNGAMAGTNVGYYYNRQTVYMPMICWTQRVICSNDIEGATIVAFGFGGQLLTMFPRTVQRFTSAGGDTPVTKSGSQYNCVSHPERCSTIVRH